MIHKNSLMCCCFSLIVGPFLLAVKGLWFRSAINEGQMFNEILGFLLYIIVHHINSKSHECSVALNTSG